MPTTTPITVFLVLELMPDEEEEALSPERAAIPVDTVVPVVVDEETDVTSEPETVMTEVIRSTLVYDEVEVTRVDELDSGVEDVFEFEVVFTGVLVLLEGGGVEVDDVGVELGGVEEGILLGVLLGLADDEVWEVGVEDGVDDTDVEEEGVLLVDDTEFSTFDELELVAESDTAFLPLSCLPKILASNQLACAIARKMVMTANSRRCRRENIVDDVVLKVERRRECGVPSYLR